MNVGYLAEGCSSAQIDGLEVDGRVGGHKGPTCAAPP